MENIFDGKMFEATLEKIMKLEEMMKADKEDKEPVKESNKPKTFEDRLEESDYEVQCRVNYIMQQLDECDDEMLQTVAKIEENNVEMELIKRTKYICNSSIDCLKLQNAKLEGYLRYLEDRYDLLETMWEEEYRRIMA